MSSYTRYFSLVKRIMCILVTCKSVVRVSYFVSFVLFPEIVYFLNSFSNIPLPNINHLRDAKFTCIMYTLIEVKTNCILL